MNEMLTLPLFVILLLFTAILSSIITTMLPMLPVYWNAFKSRIKRKFTRKRKANDCSMLANTNRIEIGVLKLRVDDLEEQIDNLAKNHYTREKNKKHNIRKEVRAYLEELKTK